MIEPIDTIHMPFRLARLHLISLTAISKLTDATVLLNTPEDDELPRPLRSTLRWKRLTASPGSDPNLSKPARNIMKSRGHFRIDPQLDPSDNHGTFQNVNPGATSVI